MKRFYMFAICNHLGALVVFFFPVAGILAWFLFWLLRAKTREGNPTDSEIVQMLVGLSVVAFLSIGALLFLIVANQYGVSTALCS